MSFVVNEEVLNKELNPMQVQAALKTDGAMLILAGAGSGKTRTVTYKIAHLISEKQVDPRRILAVTFTNKAAREMQNRIQKILGARVNLEWMGTFHSVCVRILRLCLSKAPITNALGWSLNSNFTIYDDDDQKKIVRDILKEKLGEAFEASEVKKVRNAISRFKNTVYKEILPDGVVRLVLQTPEMVQAQAKYKDQELLASYYQSYQTKLMESNAMDFDDLLLKTVELFQNLPQIAKQFAYRFEYIFVDEYQDTNDVQYELLKLLTNENKNVTVVGDDDQSIYGWRGANIEIIRNFHNDYSPVQIIKLEQNYRSTSNIVKGAGSVIAHNERPPEMKKEVFSKEEAGDPILVTHVTDDRSEAEKIADRIAKAGKAFYAETAVFYRTNAQSRVLEKALNDRRIPNVIFGGTRFWDRKEIKDILAYLRLVANSKDDAALFRILNVPPRQIGKTTAEFLQETAAIQDVSVWDIIEQSTETLGRAATKIAVFRDLILKIRAEIATGEVPLPIIVEHIISEIHYKEFLEKEDETTAEDKKGNLDELINAIREFDEEHPDATLESFLQDISLLTDADKKVEQASERVTLMTIHMAKGLEFHSVHIGGCDENVFPLVRSSLTISEKELKEQLEEERRLFYVGCTRAKKKLFLYHSASRFLQGNLQQLEPSRFLEELDPSVTEVHDEKTNLGDVQLFDDFSTDDFNQMPFRKKNFQNAFRFGNSSARGMLNSSARSVSGSSRGTSNSSREALNTSRGMTNFSRSMSSTSRNMSSSSYSRFSNKTSARFGKSERIVYNNGPKVAQVKSASSGPRIVYDEYSENPLQPGVRVRHAKHGIGIILRTYGQGENARSEVRFGDGTVRTLILKFAGLEIIG